MLSASENKLLQRILASPLAREMERSLTDSTDAARQRMREILDRLNASYERKIEALREPVRTAVARRDALKKEFDEATSAANRLVDELRNTQDSFSSRRAELQGAIAARSSWLSNKNLDTVEAVDRHFRGV